MHGLVNLGVLVVSVWALVGMALKARVLMRLHQGR